MNRKQWFVAGLPAAAAILVLSGCTTAQNNVATNPVEEAVVMETPASSVNQSGTEVAQTPDMHTTKDVVDWVGTYKGTLPCASCEGIDTEITLNKDGTYIEKTMYITTKPGGGEVDTETGTFVWDAAGTTVTLTETDDDGEVDEDDRKAYVVTEGQLHVLDAAGQVITGELAENFILKKQ